MATALKYQQELDFSKPLSAQWGARFLTEKEVDALHEGVPLGDYEYVAMNLEHLHQDVENADEDLIAMTHSDLVALLEIAGDLRRLAEKSGELADRVDTYAWDLWVLQKERCGDAR